MILRNLFSASKERGTESFSVIFIALHKAIKKKTQALELLPGQGMSEASSPGMICIAASFCGAGPGLKRPSTMHGRSPAGHQTTNT